MPEITIFKFAAGILEYINVFTGVGLYALVSKFGNFLFWLIDTYRNNKGG